MSERLQYRIEAGEGGQRLDVFLAARLGTLSRMRIANLLAAGACLVDQRPRHAGYHLKTGEVVDLSLDENLPTTAMMPEPLPLDIVYQDDLILIVNKPSGMLVHPNIKTKSGTLANALVYHLNRDLYASSPPADPPAVVRPGLVHRLDRDTSGLMVVAKTQRALSILTRHFHHRLVQKRYTAIVSGVVGDEEGVINAPLGINPSKSPPRWVFADGKPAETRFRVTQRMHTTTVIELEPVTGRTNQLRIHCAYIGHPILGDILYGAGVGSQLPVVGWDQARSSGFTDHRLCLHASRLAFHHPDDGRWMEFLSPLPDEMRAIVSNQ